MIQEPWKVWKRNTVLYFFSFSPLVILYSCTAVLPCLPSSRANRRQTYPGTLHLRAFPCAPSSRVSFSNWSHTRTHRNTADHTWEHVWFSCITRFIAELPAPDGDTNRASKLPSARGRGASSSWVPGALFAFQDQRPRPCMCATRSACQRHANEHVSETWKWEQGEGEPGSVRFS